VATGHQLAMDYQRTQRGKARLSFTLRHRAWLHLVPHFCFAGSGGQDCQPRKTHCYIGADSLALNTLPYRAECTARYPLIGQFRKNSRGWADVTQGPTDKIFDPQSPTAHFALIRKSLRLIDLKCEVTATSH
jgi:hypothetical protein